MSENIFVNPHYDLIEGDTLKLKTTTRLTAEEDEGVMVELARYVEATLVESFGFEYITIPPVEDIMGMDDESAPGSTSILASKDWRSCSQLLIMCVNQSGSQMGIFSRSMCFEGGLSKGTMFPYVKRALDCKYGVIILRPNLNTITKTIDGVKTKVPIRGSESPEIHALCVWENVVSQATQGGAVKRIALFGYGNGASLCHELYLKSALSHDLNIVNAIVTVEASHVVEKDDPDDVKQVFSRIAVNFEASSFSPRGYDLKYRESRLGCRSLCLGVPKGAELTNVAISASLALQDVFAYLSLASEPAENLIDSYFMQFARRHGVTDVKSAVVLTNPDKEQELEELEKVAPESAEVEEAPKRGVFSWMFGSSGKEPSSAKKADTEHLLGVDDFQFLQLVGKGAFGKVMLVRKKNGFNAGKIYAMKVLKKSDVIDKGQIEHTKAEQAILCAIRHPYIVCLRFSFQNLDKLYLITDYYSGGNLFAHLRNDKQFPAKRAMFYAAELVLALDHLHQNEIIYRDLKLENILMDHMGHITLTDFGLSKQDIDKSGGAKTFCGTAEYIAPELLKNETYGFEVDWWSFGVLLFEMINGKTPFFDRNRKVMYHRVMTRDPTFDPSIFNADAQHCILGLLTRDKTKRLGYNGADLIMAEPFFNTIDWEKLYRRELDAPFRPKGDGVTGTSYVPQAFKDVDLQRDSSSRSIPCQDQKMASEMANAFSGFSFSEESIVRKQSNKN